MSRALLVLAAFAAVIAAASAHATLYTVDPSVGDGPAPVQSWHIHFLFMQNNKGSVARAEALYDRFVKEFNLENEKPCEGLFDQGRLCMFTPDYEPAGPFATAQWAVYVRHEDFHKTVQWSMQNRGEFSILVHPNSGLGARDHSIDALWGGKEWPIDLSIFKSMNENDTMEDTMNKLRSSTLL